MLKAFRKDILYFSPLSFISNKMFKLLDVLFINFEHAFILFKYIYCYFVHAFSNWLNYITVCFKSGQHLLYGVSSIIYHDDWFIARYSL